MKGVLLVAILSVFKANALLKDEWESFIKMHGKKYNDPIEEVIRMNIFASNKEMIENHNINFELGKHSYKLKMNCYGDLMSYEFTSLLNGYKINLTKYVTSNSSFLPFTNATLPEYVDWRESGAVTPIKNQGQCGSCWAFSATGSLEGQHFIKTGTLVSLSEQNLIDCSSSYGNAGCKGGYVDMAFKYVRENHGIDSETSYPYEAKDDVCRYNADNAVTSDIGYIDLPEGEENVLKKAVAIIGPISVGIDASTKAFQFYSEGVFYESECSKTDLDHAVLVVGYGTNNLGNDYWIVKNSWGEAWGEKGYIKMARNKNNNCGIATKASFPLV